jgi:hypothetical protein
MPEMEYGIGLCIHFLSPEKVFQVEWFEPESYQVYRVPLFQTTGILLKPAALAIYMSLLAICLTNDAKTQLKESMDWFFMIIVIQYSLFIDLQVYIALMPVNGVLPGTRNPSFSRKNSGYGRKLPPFCSQPGFVLTIFNHQQQRYSIKTAAGSEPCQMRVRILWKSS